MSGLPYKQSLCLCLPVWRQIVTNIYEPTGISYVDAHATFLSNELLPLVDKRVTDNKVRPQTLKEVVSDHATQTSSKDLEIS